MSLNWKMILPKKRRMSDTIRSKVSGALVEHAEFGVPTSDVQYEPIGRLAAPRLAWPVAVSSTSPASIEQHEAPRCAAPVLVLRQLAHRRFAGQS